ncbi:DegT/DnrJ/EryC1/StrS family aminotransferase [Flavobacteriaceae bacterium]|nr:DegT/DnrJ/EryC1/StrS family aminotransferase [Flavobacteriaceae bacterium]
MIRIQQTISMVDLKTQYQKIKSEIDRSVINTIESSLFIGGPIVEEFKNSLQNYLNVKHVIPCANGTDALQIALMSLNLQKGDEVIVPSFTYVAAAEVIVLLGLTPVMVDVNVNNFNICIQSIEKAVTPKTKAIIPVNLFGQSSPMEELVNIANKYDLYIIEDNAQALGSDYIFNNGLKKKTGTIGDIGCTSFFPTKNLGCYGDGGAIYTDNEELAEKIRVIAVHGQSKKYHHKVIGCNSRLDALQASILNIKLKYLDIYNLARSKASEIYTKGLSGLKELETPITETYSNHVFHQYTIKVKNNKRDALKEYLRKNDIPSIVYYPIPLYKQEAFLTYLNRDFKLVNTEILCNEVLSLPMHSELDKSIQQYIVEKIKMFFNG